MKFKAVNSKFLTLYIIGSTFEQFYIFRCYKCRTSVTISFHDSTLFLLYYHLISLLLANKMNAKFLFLSMIIIIFLFSLHQMLHTDETTTSTSQTKYVPKIQSGYLYNVLCESSVKFQAKENIKIYTISGLREPSHTTHGRRNHLQ